MCGRGAQTQYAVRAAAADLMGETAGFNSNHRTASSSSPSEATHRPPHASNSSGSTDEHDNYNLSPGMDAVVFWKRDNNSSEIQMGRKTWGLVSRGGSQKSPLPEGMSLHFSNLMFNARSDTLFARPTFARLAHEGKSCLIAMDGFFEWKTELGKKQPYFVYRRRQQDDAEESEQHSRPYLLLAGLWTSVSTGRNDPRTLDTFTILTTEACPALQWLHSRMPVIIWDHQHLARQWLEHPTASTLAALDAAARHDTTERVLQWHAVTPQMSSMKFRTAAAIRPIPKPRSVKSFFQNVAKSNDGATRKEAMPSPKEKDAATDATTALQDTTGKKRAERSQAAAPPKSKKSTPTTTASAKKKLKVSSSPPPKRGPMDAFVTKLSSSEKSLE